MQLQALLYYLLYVEDIFVLHVSPGMLNLSFPGGLKSSHLAPTEEMNLAWACFKFLERIDVLPTDLMTGV